MRAEILSIGTELLLGTIADTNAQYLAQRLAGLGIDCFYISQVGDNQSRLVDTVRRAWERSDLVVTTGGLGPTQDDLTREAVSEMLGETPTVMPEQEEKLRSFFALRGVAMPERNLKQALVIPSASLLDNPVGTAPGWWVERGHGVNKRTIVSMPGVPFEMKRMWEGEVEPRLQARSQDVLVSRTLKVIGLGESRVEELVVDLMYSPNPSLAPYAKQDGVHLRITAKAANQHEAGELISGVERKVRQRLGEAVYGADGDTLDDVTSKLLEEAAISLAVLEVGAGMVGAIGPLLGAASQVAGVIGIASLTALGGLLEGVDGPPGTLGEAAEAVKAHTGASFVLAGMAQLTQHEGDPDSVVARVKLVLFGGSGEHSVSSSEQSWQTSKSEVRRLAGLAALNILRLYLLSQKMVKS